MRVEKLHLDRAITASSTELTRVLVHWQRCLLGFQIPAVISTGRPVRVPADHRMTAAARLRQMVTLGPSCRARGTTITREACNLSRGVVRPRSTLTYNRPGFRVTVTVTVRVTLVSVVRTLDFDFEHKFFSLHARR